jgi:hypothetical protein
MKSIIVLRAASFRSLGPRLLDPVILAELIEAVKTRYNFRQVPTVAEASEKPANFGYGEIKRGDSLIVVEQLLVSYLGNSVTSVGASTRTSTDDADFFLDDTLRWISERYHLDIAPVFAPAYHSSLEIVFDESISRRFQELRPIGQAITNLVKSYGQQNCPDFELEGLSMHFEINPALLPSPLPFSVQRRAGSRYAENKYFSQAPLRTGDHKSVLEQLEKILVA